MILNHLSKLNCADSQLIHEFGFFALTVIMLQSISLSSQSISYNYDQAGNRIARRVINLPPAPAKFTSPTRSHTGKADI